MYILCSVIETITLNTTCFAVRHTFNLGWNCTSYLLSKIFKSKRESNCKFIYLEDIIILNDVDTRSKYIDYDDSDDEYIECDVVEKQKTTPCHIEMIHPVAVINESTSAYESTSAFRMHDSLNEEYNDTLLDKQVKIIKEIINDEKYLNNDIDIEIKNKKDLEEYLKNEYDKRVKEELDNEWVNIQVFE